METPVTRAPSFITTEPHFATAVGQTKGPHQAATPNGNKMDHRAQWQQIRVAHSVKGCPQEVLSMFDKALTQIISSPVSNS